MTTVKDAVEYIDNANPVSGAFRAASKYCHSGL
jgi:hypothetical protein